MNENSRSSNSVKNISFGLITQAIQMILGFVGRWVFILYLSKEYLGVNQLFTEILTYLSLADLGIGNAILFSLYKPLANKDLPTIAGLMKYFKKIYSFIGGIVFIAGLCLMPFLHNIVKNVPEQLSNDLYLIYLLFLINTASSYFFSYRFNLLHADQKSYLLAKRNIIIIIIQYILQITILVLTQNFILYLCVQIGSTILGNYWNTFLVRKHYAFVEEYKHVNISSELKNQIFVNAKSTAIVKVGGLVVNNSTAIILNYFSGLTAVGLLSNYNMLIALTSSLIVQVFSGLTGSIANVNAKESRQKKRDTFHLINFANFYFYGTASVLIALLMNDFITIWIGKDFLLPYVVVLILTLNFYILGMQNAVWTFKSTLGFFKQGRYLILLNGFTFATLAFILGNFWGLPGILISLTLTRLSTVVWYDPYIVFKLGLKYSVIHYFKKYILYVIIVASSIFITLGVTSFLNIQNILLLFIIKLILGLFILNMLIILFFNKTKEIEYLKIFFIDYLKRIFNKIKK